MKGASELVLSFRIHHSAFIISSASIPPLCASKFCQNSSLVIGAKIQGAHGEQF
jgi:hypothetical protein